MFSQNRAAGEWLKGQSRGTRVMLRILLAVVTAYVVLGLWLIPQMMRAVPLSLIHI